MILWLLACITQPPAEVPVLPDLDPPFTAQAIHDAMPVGARIRFRRDRAGTIDEPIWEVVAATPEQVELAMSVQVQGIPQGDPVRKTFQWEELERHAHFDPARTVFEAGEVVAGVGRFPGKRYTVTDPDSGEVQRYHFADPLPGPPILMVTERDGRVVERLEVLARTPPLP